MCEFHTKTPTSNRHLQLAAPLAALLCRNSMKRVSQRVFLVKKKWKTSQKLELNSICLFHCRWRKLWRVSKTTAEGKNRVRHKLKGTQSAVGLRWPGHYFCQFEKHLPQPAIKCTHQIHLEIPFNLARWFIPPSFFHRTPLFEHTLTDPMTLFYHIWLKRVSKGTWTEEVRIV